MSLINDVLKDLERRKATEGAHAPRSTEQPRARRARRRSPRWTLWLLAAIAVGAVLHLSLEDTSPIGDGRKPQTLTARAGTTPAPDAVLDAGKPETQSDAPSQRKPAELGSEETPSRSTSDAESTDATAQRRVDPERPRGGPSRQEPVQPEPPEPLESTPARETEPAPKPEPNISIRRADGEAGQEDLLATAKRMLSRGQYQRAESRLRQLTEDRPELTEPYELLAGALMRRGRHDSAMRVLDDGLGRASEPAPLAALLGRQLLERGEIARARDILRHHAPAMAEAPEYHLLLAATHRQAGDHAAAAEHYRALTGILPRSGAAWIGLGASLESLEHPAEAAKAYNRALEGDDDRAARFARQRLAALAPITGEPQ
ncbi:tetratricopeptide repeat protein [Wenzhouxiangella sediminis]|uniref:Uncharacterized protein n=1 Tax=Wenzhouxiangella sediminis TaxID=1792836 RepID=A0A3E1KCK1_9GAMM|nr:tetratricopeptide repeat protein [Wenzhouxiangella sediminis]RFF32698.1 hypothetical protein DZC52_00825 [Wenzhouxiangella sediminis]